MSMTELYDSDLISLLLFAFYLLLHMHATTFLERGLPSPGPLFLWMSYLLCLSLAQEIWFCRLSVAVSCRFVSTSTLTSLFLLSPFSAFLITQGSFCGVCYRSGWWVDMVKNMVCMELLDD